MTDFVLEQIPKCEIDKEIMSYNLFILFEKYANFLKQPPQQWMFDKEDERCLFEGFECKHHHSTKKSICTVDNFFHVFWNTNDFWELSKGIFTIEDLVKYNLRLTPTAIKQIGL